MVKAEELKQKPKITGESGLRSPRDWGDKWAMWPARSQRFFGWLVGFGVHKTNEKDPKSTLFLVSAASSYFFSKFCFLSIFLMLQSCLSQGVAALKADL